MGFMDKFKYFLVNGNLPKKEPEPHFKGWGSLYELLADEYQVKALSLLFEAAKSPAPIDPNSPTITEFQIHVLQIRNALQSIDKKKGKGKCRIGR